MSAPSMRQCPQCREAAPTGASRCPHCGATLSIVTMPIEALPPDTGAPEETAEATDIEPATGELLPLEDEGIERTGTVARSYSVSTSFSTTTSSGGSRHVDAEVKIDLPQAVIDPDSRLSPTAYWKLMHRWSEAIERDVEAASKAGGSLDLAEAVRRVPLPFGPDCGGELPVAIRDAMTQRAYSQAAHLFSLPKPADIFGPHAGPDASPRVRELLEAAGRANRPRRGFTVTCGSVVGGVLLCGALGLCLGWWALAS